MTFTAAAVPGSSIPAPFDSSALLTLAEIADLLGRDPKTVKTWRACGRWPGSVQDATGRRAWRVPVADLVAAGDLDPSHVSTVEGELATCRESRETRALREQVIRLEEQVVAAQALADERAATVALLQTLITRGGAA